MLSSMILYIYIYILLFLNLLNCLFIPEITQAKNFKGKAIQVSVTQKNISTESIVSITRLMTIETNCL